MIGTHINIEMTEKLYKKMGLTNKEIRISELNRILSINLNELEADLFNSGNWSDIQKINDLQEVYDQAGIILKEFDETLY